MVSVGGLSHGNDNGIYSGETYLRRVVTWLPIILLFACLSSRAQGLFSTIISQPEPLPNCTPGAAGIEMPVLWDVTAATFMFCSGPNAWSPWAGGGGGGGNVTSVGLQINGATSSGIFAVSGSPVILSGNLNYNLSGNPGGVTYFSTTAILSSSSTLTANLPVLGGGAGNAPTSGSVTGNTTRFATFNGSATAGRCIDTDVNGNLQVTAQDCNTTPGSIQTNGVTNASQAVINFQNAGLFVWSNPSGGNEQVNFGSQSANFFIAAPNGSAGIPIARAMVAADVPAGNTCGANNFTRGLNAALTSVCAQPAFSNLSGTISLAQTVLTTNGDLLSVSAGALARVASAGGQDFILQGASAAVPVWLAINNCGSGTQALSYSTTTHTFGCQSITVGTGTINNALQFSGAYYSGSGSNNVINGISPPTTPSVSFLWCSTPSGGLAAAPTWCEPGIPINAQVGTSYTVTTSDRENLDTMSNSGAIAVTLPQAGTTGFDANFNFALANINTGLVTITPTTSTINGNATQIVPNHWFSFIHSDNANYRAGTFPDIAAFPACTNALQFTTATGVISCGLISLTAGVSGITPILNGGTSASTAANAAIALLPVATRAGDIIYWDGSIWNHLAGNNSGTQFLSETSGGVPSWAANSTTVTWDAIQNPAGNLSLTMAADTTLFTYNATTGAAVDMFKLIDTTNNTGTGILLHATVASGSALTPWQADNGGKGWRVTSSGNLVEVGGASLAIPGTAHGIVISENASFIATTAVGGSNFPLIGSSGADPIWSTITYPITAVSGGVICATSTTGLASSALLALNAVVIGGGAGACPTASSALPNGTTGTTQASGDSSTDVATDAFVSAAISGVDPAIAVQAATTQASDTSGFTYSNGVSGIGATFTGSVNTAITIDGFTFTALGQRLLVKNDTQSPSGAFNGIYSLTVLQTVAVAPVLTRALDYDAPSDINNTGAIPVVNGTANANTSWVETAQIVTVGTTPLTFAQFSLSPSTLVTAASNGTTKQICTVASSNKACTWIDFPERLNIPAANCNNATGGAGWSIGSGGTVACRAGTNNLGGYISITDTSSTFAQFQLSIPVDWDTATNPYILFGLISVTDTTNGHTVIPQIKVSCPTATNGTVSDDHAFAAAHSATTITMGASAVANGFYTTSVQMNSTDMTGCVAGGMMIVQVGRATDTATGTIGFEYADVTFPRLLAVQAN